MFLLFEYFYKETYSLTLTDRAPIPILSDFFWGGGSPSILATVTDKDIKFIFGGSCLFLEKITFSSYSGLTAP